MAQGDNFHEAKRCKRRISNNTSQTAKIKPVPTSTTVKLPQKSVLTRNFSTSLRTMDMDMKTTGTGGSEKTR
jgi:hypothetical protein